MITDENSDDCGKAEPMTKMKLKLKNEVREDLYDYLHN